MKFQVSVSCKYNAYINKTSRYNICWHLMLVVSVACIWMISYAKTEPSMELY
jgi:hypothetical protein